MSPRDRKTSRKALGRGYAAPTNSAETHAAIAADQRVPALARIMADPEHGKALERHERAVRAEVQIAEAVRLLEAARLELREAVGDHAATRRTVDAHTEASAARELARQLGNATRRALQ